MPSFLKHFLPLFLWMLLLFSQTLFAQALQEVAAPSHIKSIEFRGKTEDQFPIVRLGEPFELHFDDLQANEQDYFYKIVHCKANWTPSDLLKSQYLEGIDNQRITDHKNSYNTLVAYSHFRLILPNEVVAPKISGNYMLQVFDTSDNLIFSRKFMIYEDLVGVQAAVKRSRSFELMNSHQLLQFILNVRALNLNKPERELQVVLLKNYQWDTAKYDLQPQFNNGTELKYDYDQPASFFGGNEYLNFDTKDIRAATATIGEVALNDIYEHYLYANEARNNKPYTYFPDLNGDFRVRTLQGAISEREADYSWVHFSLNPSGNGSSDTDIYILGKFNNYTPSSEYKMSYEASSNSYKARILFKQGFYNYSFALGTSTTDSASIYQNNSDLEPLISYDPYAISGSFHFTENQYQIFVYFKGFGDLYQRLVGVGAANAAFIKD